MEIDDIVENGHPQPLQSTQDLPSTSAEVANIQGTLSSLIALPKLLTLLNHRNMTSIQTTPPAVQPHILRENFRDIQVKVHIRRPEKDSWVYLGRGTVTQEVTGHSSRVGALIPKLWMPNQTLPIVLSCSYGVNGEGNDCI
jgi:hypothetical protein